MEALNEALLDIVQSFRVDSDNPLMEWRIVSLESLKERLVQRNHR